MADGPYRKKNFGFGREGEDSSADRAYDFLDTLGRGEGAKFLIALICKYLDEQDKSTKIIGTGRVLIVKEALGKKKEPPKPKKRRQPPKSVDRQQEQQSTPIIPPEPVMPINPVAPAVAEDDPAAATAYRNESLSKEDRKKLNKALSFDDDDGEFNF